MSADTSLGTAALEAEIRQLREAIRTRTLIGQATGILMERHKIKADAAFAILVRSSQEQNRKVRDVAADMVSQHAFG